MDDGALLDIVRLSARASERRAAACEVLVSRHQGLVRSCVRRYMNSSESPEDLMQVGYVGLLKAISSYDPVFCRSLATYARPCISGELKRHFRDKRWQVHVKRPVQELVLEVREATWRLAQELGRMPADSDLTRLLGISGDDLRHAQQADAAFQSHSLDAPLTGGRGRSILADFLGAEDPGLEHMLSMHAVAAHWGELSPRERKILLMRFRGGMTQVQIGERLGISQMHVSRLLTRALGYLRSHLLDLEARLAHRKGPGTFAEPATRPGTSGPYHRGPRRGPVDGTSQRAQHRPGRRPDRGRGQGASIAAGYWRRTEGAEKFRAAMSEEYPHQLCTLHEGNIGLADDCGA